MEKNLDKVDWGNLSQNPNAMPILEKNQIDWYWINRNPSLFQLDYSRMKENNKEFFKELVEKVFHRDRVIRMANMFQMDLYEYLDYI